MRAHAGLDRVRSVAAVILLGATTLSVQAAEDPFEQTIIKVAPELAASSNLKTLPPEQQVDAAFFVVGNMLFSVVHEFGHAVMSEMQMPVLGRMEDAADSFAMVTGLKMMTDTSIRALIEAGKGWFFTDLSERKSGGMTAYYESHGMNLQRAYQIVCYMVGANPERFKALADMTKLPASRQTTCKDDYAIAAWSWEELLKPYVRSPDTPRSKIDVVYNEATGPLAVYQKTFKELRFLDRLADMATNKFTWRRPLVMSMETCGKVNAWWSEPNAKITVCYELVDEFVQLYLQFMSDPAMEKRMEALNPPLLTR